MIEFAEESSVTDIEIVFTEEISYSVGFEYECSSENSKSLVTFTTNSNGAIITEPNLEELESCGFKASEIGNGHYSLTGKIL